jgi:hypothetical protein
VLARVIVRLGSLPEVHGGVIEGLYASDLAYLQRLYERFNSDEGEPELPAGLGAAANAGSALRRMTTLGEA